MGKHLAFMLRRAKIEVPYVIDNNCSICSDISVYRLGEEIPKVDMIIISVLEGCEEIKKQLRQYYNYKIIDIREVGWEKRK